MVSAVVFHGEAGLHPHHVAGVLAFGLAEGRQAKDVVFPYLDAVGILHVGLLAEGLGVDLLPVAAVGSPWLVDDIDGVVLTVADWLALVACDGFVEVFTALALNLICRMGHSSFWFAEKK